MAVYFIDYENVHDEGLDGVASLQENDRVIVFYGEQIKSISFERHMEMMNSKARVEYIETHKTAKNYLDFQLSTYLGFLIGKGESGPVYIVSRDTGFDSVIDFWKGRNTKCARQDRIAEKEKKQRKRTGKKESRAENTSDKLSEVYRKKIRAAVKEDELTAGNYTSIYRAMTASKDKLELNNMLVKAFGSARGGAVYNHVRSIYEEYQAHKA